MPFLPESPRRSVIVNQLDKAKASLRKVYGESVSESFLDKEVANIAHDVEITRSSTYKDFLLRENYWPLIIGKIVGDK